MYEELIIKTYPIYLKKLFFTYIPHFKTLFDVSNYNKLRNHSTALLNTIIRMGIVLNNDLTTL